MDATINNDETIIVCITNITLQPYLGVYLSQKYNVNKKNIRIIESSDYRNVAYHDIIAKACIVIVLNVLEVEFPDIYNEFTYNIDKINEYIIRVKNSTNDLFSYIRGKTEAFIIWFGYENHTNSIRVIYGNSILLNGFIENINSYLLDITDEYSVVIDTGSIIAKLGIDKAIEQKGKYRWGMFYSNYMIKFISNEIYKQHSAFNNKCPKCIILDCDNVLWGGIISEDGIGGVHLSQHGSGKFYKEFQNLLLTLYYNGIILAVCSKNDLSDVMSMFDTHKEMLIQKNHISCFKVNWENKVNNIIDISEKLKIGLKDIVFIDDSQIEIDAVKKFIPEIKTILFDKKTIYTEMNCFNIKNKSNQQSAIRQLTYNTNKLRSELRLQSGSYEDYLSSLNTEVNISKSQDSEAGRIAELSQRTNRMTTGKRYNIQNIKQMLDNEHYDMYSIYVKDRFSDLGLVGSFIIRDKKQLELINLSCRAIGRNIENQVTEYINTKYPITNVKYISTGKNYQFVESIKLLLLT